MTLDNLTPWPVEAFPSYDTHGPVPRHEPMLCQNDPKK
ncbi:hypothetical protein DB30_04594 [Enhygromyxa salina]|uniref:Uncharacterized protein n=1 Tax=Enhygromyxa salina TaxID=215803 RepID=A0A0C1ZNS1_9BACT|nr:hypothetical protein DB30_04594 [Enhygromyxa salina]